MNTCNFKYGNSLRMVIRAKFKYLPKANLILLKHVHVHPQHPYIKDENSYTSPGGKIPWESRIICDWEMINAYDQDQQQ